MSDPKLMYCRLRHSEGLLCGCRPDECLQDRREAHIPDTKDPEE